MNPELTAGADNLIDGVDYRPEPTVDMDGRECVLRVDASADGCTPALLVRDRVTGETLGSALAYQRQGGVLGVAQVLVLQQPDPSLRDALLQSGAFTPGQRTHGMAVRFAPLAITDPDLARRWGAAVETANGVREQRSQTEAAAPFSAIYVARFDAAKGETKHLGLGMVDRALAEDIIADLRRSGETVLTLPVADRSQPPPMDRFPAELLETAAVSQDEGLEEEAPGVSQEL